MEDDDKERSLGSVGAALTGFAEMAPCLLACSVCSCPILPLARVPGGPFYTLYHIHYTPYTLAGWVCPILHTIMVLL